MNERNGAMTALLATDAPAARDLGFEIAVLLRIERRRYRRGVAMVVAIGLLATAVLAALMPGLGSAAAHAFAGVGDWVLAAALLTLSLPVQGWIAKRF